MVMKIDRPLIDGLTCDRKYFNMRLQLVARIRSLQESSPLKSNKSRTGSLKSQNSMRTKASSVSRKSKASSSRSLKLEAAVKTARLKTEMTFLERDNEIRRMQLAEERAINNALVDECKEIEVKQEPTKTLDPFAPPQIPYSPPCQSRDITETKPKVTQINPQDNPGNSPPKVPSQQQKNSVANQEIKAADSPIVLPICQQSPTQETLKELISLQAKQTELGSLLIRQQRKLNLPSKEPPVFSGNALDYPAFTTAFDSIICENVPSNKDRLYFLDKYTAGKANEVVKGFLAVNSEHSYTEARKLFNQRFGNPVHVAQAYKSRLRNWPHVKDGDSVALQEFSDFLFRCQEAVKITDQRIGLK